MVEGQDIVERLLQDALGEVPAVVADVVKVNRQAALVLLEHQDDVRSVAARMRIAWVRGEVSHGMQQTWTWD